MSDTTTNDTLAAAESLSQTIQRNATLFRGLLPSDLLEQHVRLGLKFPALVKQFKESGFVTRVEGSVRLRPELVDLVTEFHKVSKQVFDGFGGHN